MHSYRHVCTPKHFTITHLREIHIFNDRQHKNVIVKQSGVSRGNTPKLLYNFTYFNYLICIKNLKQKINPHKRLKIFGSRGTPISRYRISQLIREGYHGISFGERKEQFWEGGREREREKKKRDWVNYTVGSCSLSSNSYVSFHQV